MTTKKQLPNLIKDTIEALREHWVYDAVQLLNDSAVGLHRIEDLLTELHERPEWSKGCEAEIIEQVSDFVSFIKDWEALAHKRLSDSLVCPHEVEYRLDKLLKATKMPLPKKKRLRRRWSADSLEPLIVTIARRSWA